MSATAAMTRGVIGALLVARFDARGFAVFGRDGSDAIRSFWAAVLVFPMFMGWVAINGFGTPAEAPLPMAFLYELLVYAGGWLLFPVLMWQVAGGLGRRQRFAHFVCAYNWCSVVQNAIFMILDILSLGFGASKEARAFFGLLLLTYVMIYGWYVAKKSLDINAYQAALVVGIDILTALTWEGFTDGLVRAT